MIRNIRTLECEAMLVKQRKYSLQVHQIQVQPSINRTVMLLDKYLLAGSRTYPSPQGVQASLVPGAGDITPLLRLGDLT
jgi:hypothetical protein